MKKRESTHQKLKTLTIVLCLVFVLLFPLNAEDKESAHTKSAERSAGKSGIDSPPEETIGKR